MPASSSGLDRRRDPRRAGALVMACTLPYAVRMVRGHVEDVPGGLKESASTDGCTRWQARLKVVLPVAPTGIFATVVFTFIFPWNDYIFVLVLTRIKVMTLIVEGNWHFGARSRLWAKVPSMSVLRTLPTFLAVATMEGYLVPGISLGAVRGWGVADQAGASAPPVRVP
jgi:multiple sugar transport system permease protein